jgi:alanyl-tRNA synthetase
LTTAEGAVIDVTDTQKQLGALFVHLGTVKSGTVSVGDVMQMAVDGARRSAIRANHSATHLLHEALRRHLGEHVTQKGSLVAPDRLRFDISHQKSLDAEEIAAVEQEVNDMIRQNTEVSTRVMTPDDAIEAGALALFGEKYGDEVRVLTMGTRGDSSKPDHAYSVELCGGTHVRRTGDIGLFKIVGEGAVASGVRRIEALTGAGALEYLNSQDRLVKNLASLLKTSGSELPERLNALIGERKRLEREAADARKALALGGGASSGGGDEVEDIGGVKVLAKCLDGVSAKDLRGLIDEAKGRLGSGVVTFIAVEGEKVAVAVGVTDDLTATHNAVDLVRLGSAALGGKGGGGRPDMAQAGGADPTKAQAALDAIKAGVRA